MIQRVSEASRITSDLKTWFLNLSVCRPDCWNALFSSLLSLNIKTISSLTELEIFFSNYSVMLCNRSKHSDIHRDGLAVDIHEA